MTDRSPAEDRLATLLHDAAGELSTSDGFWDEVDGRARRRARRRTVGRSSAALAVAACAVLAVSVLGPGPSGPDVGTIAPVAPAIDRVSVVDDERDEASTVDRETLRDLLARERELRVQVGELERAIHIFEVEAGNAALGGDHRTSADAALRVADARLVLRVTEEQRRQVVSTLRDHRRGGFPALTGYGDLGEVPLPLVDAYDLTASLARCLLEHSVAVAVLPPGDGLAFLDGDHPFARELQVACMAGLGIDEDAVARGTVGREHRELRRAYDEALHACLRDAGARVRHPGEVGPDLWSPYEHLADTDAALRHRCPSSPVGGLGAYTPGAAVTPAGPLPDLPSLPPVPSAVASLGPS